ncbi:hypothetical protein [Acrocarpospora sp. B8E8]
MTRFRLRRWTNWDPFNPRLHAPCGDRGCDRCWMTLDDDIWRWPWK